MGEDLVLRKSYEVVTGLWGMYEERGEVCAELEMEEKK